MVVCIVKLAADVDGPKCLRCLNENKTQSNIINNSYSNRLFLKLFLTYIVVD